MLNAFKAKSGYCSEQNWMQKQKNLSDILNTKKSMLSNTCNDKKIEKEKNDIFYACKSVQNRIILFCM